MKIENTRKTFAPAHTHQPKLYHPENTPQPNLSTQKTETKQLQNGRAAQLQFERYRRLCNIQSLLLIINLAMLFLYYELDFQGAQSAKEMLACSYVVHLAIVFMEILAVCDEWTQLQNHERKISSLILPLLKVLTILILQPMPWANNASLQVMYNDKSYNQFDFPLKLNYLLVLFSFLKTVAMLTPNIIVNSEYGRPRCHRLYKMHQIMVDQTLYGFKCIFGDMPLLTFFTLFVVVLLFFSFTIRVLERGIPVQPNPFQYFQNCVWFIAVTVTTVGFGDFVIRSSLSYFLLIFCELSGVISISVLVVILVNTLSVNSSQSEALRMLNRIETHCERKRVSGEYIREALWRTWRNYKDKREVKQSLHEKKLKKMLGKIKQQTTANSSASYNSLEEEMENKFDNALISVEYLRQNNHELLSYISNNMFMSGQQKVPSPKNQKDNVNQAQETGPKHAKIAKEKTGRKSKLLVNLPTLNIPNEQEQWFLGPTHTQIPQQ